MRSAKRRGVCGVRLLCPGEVVAYDGGGMSGIRLLTALIVGKARLRWRI